MQELVKIKWMGRLLQKSAIEEALTEYHNMLEEAERSFQVKPPSYCASLIDVFHAPDRQPRRDSLHRRDAAETECA